MLTPAEIRSKLWDLRCKGYRVEYHNAGGTKVIISGVDLHLLEGRVNRLRAQHSTGVRVRGRDPETDWMDVR